MARRSFRRRLTELRRKGGIIFLPTAIFAFLAPIAPTARAETFNAVVFSYGLNYIEQTIDISGYAGQISSIAITPSVMSTQGGPDKVGTAFEVKDSSDQQLLSINMDGASLADTDSSWFEASVSADIEDSSSWSTLTIRIWGKDAENWGGNYGPMIRSVSVQAKLNQDTEWTDLSSLITNPNFSSVSNYAPDGWTSDQTWDTCQGLTSATLCVGTIEIQSATPPSTTTSTTTTTTTTLAPAPTVQGSGTEGLRQYVNLSAPEGYVFTEVVFASYGLPENFTINEACHASSSESVVAGLALGNSSVSINVTNTQFGEDPCGGTQKRLQVILAYGVDTTSTTTTTTTTVPQSIGAPLNLTVTEIETGFFLDWDEPTEGNVSPERYAVSWEVQGVGGWGWATGNVGDENALITEITVPYSILESTGGLDQTYVFSIRSDNDTLSMYSSWSNNVELLVSAPTTTTTPPPTTTTTVPPTTTTTVPPTTTTTPPAPVVAPPPVTSAAPTTAPPTTAPPTTAAPTTVATTAPTTVATTTPTTAPTTAPTTVATTVVKTTEPATTQPQKETETSLAQPEQPTEPKPEENQNPVSEPETNTENEAETGQEVVEVLDTVEELIAAISDSGSVAEFSSQQLAEVFSEENLSSLDDEEIAELIDAIDVESLSDEQAEAIAISLSSAPDDVKEEFESEINVFSGTFDSYVPKGSTISVGQRRLIVAATAVIFAMPAPVVSRSRGV